MEFTIYPDNGDRSKSNKAEGNQVHLTKIQMHSTQTTSRIDCKWLYYWSFEGPVEKKIVYVHGLTEKITRDQLELNLEEFADCAVNEVMYGLDPSFAVVVFDEPLGRYILHLFLFNLWTVDTCWLEVSYLTCYLTLYSLTAQAVKQMTQFTKDNSTQKLVMCISILSSGYS